MEYSDQEVVALLANDDKSVFEHLFKHYYAALGRFSLKYVRSEELAEEVVQEVFLYIWEKRHTLKITTSLNAYLYAAVKNRSINQIKSHISKLEVHEDLTYETTAQSSIETEMDYPLLQKLVTKAIETLPERCQMIYNLSRNSGMTYAEIATELDLSKKTVEAQMGIALKKLRTYINSHWDKITLIILCLDFYL